MNISVDITIMKPKTTVWSVITDIENCAGVISNIENIKVLEKPSSGLVGLKWQETRVMYGKSATEVMWITQAKELEFYSTRAQSHGCVYTTTLALTEAGKGTCLSMSFSGEAQTWLSKVMSFCLSGVISKSMKKALLQDLRDIKHYTEML